MTETTSTHPAVLASENSARFAMAKDKDAWLGLFADDAFLADPVGPSPFDPKGVGRRGRAEIAKFWDTAIARANLRITASQRIPCGNCCAAVLVAENDLGGGRTTRIDMVGIYEVGDDGKLVSVKVYWSWDQLAAQMRAHGLM